MPQVIAWKCPKSGKLFANLADYRTHLKRAGRLLFHKRKVAIAERDLALKVRNELWQLTEFTEISSWLLANQHLLRLVNRPRGRATASRTVLKSFTFTKCVWKQRMYSGWSITSEPGWKVSVAFELDKQDDFAAKFFSNIGIDLVGVRDTGGGFRADAYLMDRNFRNLAMYQRLKGELVFS